MSGVTLHLGLLLALLSVPSSTFADTSGDAFVALHSLVGDWEAKTATGSRIRVSYRPISKDSALVETFTTPSVETLTIYHRDGPNLIATHYCAQGNQPRLRVQSESTKTNLQFSFYDATNLRAPNASHLTRLRFQLRDADHFDKTEVYTEGGINEETVLNFVRVQR